MFFGKHFHKHLNLISSQNFCSPKNCPLKCCAIRRKTVLLSPSPFMFQSFSPRFYVVRTCCAIVFVTKVREQPLLQKRKLPRLLSQIISEAVILRCFKISEKFSQKTSLVECLSQKNHIYYFRRIYYHGCFPANFIECWLFS